jgi:hypothetical protein
MLSPKDVIEPPVSDPPPPWAMAAAAKHIGVSVRHLERLADGSKVKTIRIGGRRFVPHDEMVRICREGC